VEENPEATTADTAKRLLTAAADAEIPEVSDVETIQLLRVSDGLYLLRVAASDGDVGSVEVSF
jgi:hypothetical protein